MGLLDIFLSKAADKLKILDTGLYSFRNNIYRLLTEVCEEDTRANASETPVTLKITQQDWDKIAKENSAKLQKPANQISAGDDVIELYPSVENLGGWKNLLLLLEEIGIKAKLKFASTPSNETVIDIQIQSKDGQPFYKKLNTLLAIIQSRKLDDHEP